MIRSLKVNNFDIDVIIVTKNRDKQLLLCIEHLCTNTINPKNLIVIDSSESVRLKTQKRIASICKHKNIFLNYCKVNPIGVGFSRNVGLGKIKSPHFAFLDDDEIAPRDWIYKISKIFKSKKDIHVLAGPKIPLLKNNYWHRVMRTLIEKEFQFVGSVETIPSGNSIYLTSFITKHKLNFDERFKQCSEDQAFSLELKKRDANIYFHREVWVKHDTRRELIPFIRQWFYYGINKYLFQMLYLGGGRIFERSKFDKNLHNFKKTFPYFGKLGNISIWPGLVILNLAFLFGYLYASFK